MTWAPHPNPLILLTSWAHRETASLRRMLFSTTHSSRFIVRSGSGMLARGGGRPEWQSSLRRCPSYPLSTLWPLLLDLHLPAGLGNRNLVRDRGMPFLSSLNSMAFVSGPSPFGWPVEPEPGHRAWHHQSLEPSQKPPLPLEYHPEWTPPDRHPPSAN